MPTPADAYADLLTRSRETAVLGSCSAVLGWDQQTYMPPAGAAFRGEQLALLAGLTHAKATDPAIGERLAAVEGSDVVADPDSDAAANVRELRHSYDRAVKLPQRLVEELARVTTAAQQTWQEARANNHFPTFRPHLERILELKREEADAVGHGGQRYDALLDEYEPGATAAEVEALFADLIPKLVPLVQAAANSPPPRTDVLTRTFPIDRQKWFAEAAAAAIGFDFAAGRLDTTIHPFCSGFGPGDCRITTRYNPRMFAEAFFGTLHEAGHGMYEQGLPADKFGSPCGAYCSLGVHESQSRLWENQVGRGRAFWDCFFPRLKQAFPGTLDDVPPDDFFRAVNAVKPSYIRVEADETTYNLHVALRFRIECDLLSGELPVADLPAAWNGMMQELIGITPPSDALGCLQDVHWSFGGFGYFPTYTLGNLYAAQLRDAAAEAIGPDRLTASIRIGEFRPLNDWLNENVYRHGRKYRAAELCRRATGRDLSADPLLNHLAGKA